ncbi:MAG: hypothetical protein ACJ8FO_11050 [Sphingomicrobium sp.]
MIGLVMIAEVAAADVAQAQKAALETYQTCVSKNAKDFRRSDLSGDQLVIVVYAAAYTCSGERAGLIQKTKLFLHSRHPDLTAGSLGKVTAMFIEKQDSELEQQLVTELGQR